MRRGVSRLGLAVWCAVAVASAADLRFVLLGDRTGEAQAGVYERVWQAFAPTKPAFVVSVGDTIQGLEDAKAEGEWRAVQGVLAPYRAIPLYLAPGNHDIWSALSERLFKQYAGHAPHYSFDREGAHFAVLDTSRSDALSESELAWLEADLRAHQRAHPDAPVKMVVTHRPTWIMDAALGNTQSPLHQLAKRYGVCCLIAGHVHQLIHAELEGVTYYALPSAGGHLRLSASYEDGWFFGWTEVAVNGQDVRFQVHALEGAVTPLSAWGRAGLVKR